MKEVRGLRLLADTCSAYSATLILVSVFCLVAPCWTFRAAPSFVLESPRESHVPNIDYNAASLDLSAQELAELEALHVSIDDVWRERLRTSSLYDEGRYRASAARRNGVPLGVTCNEVDWCDSSGICSTVCERGSVVVDPWLQHALSFQWRLTRQLPFCYAQLPGSHNSGISLADGYGNRDTVYEDYLQYLGHWLGPADQSMQTNNQLISLTDQMNLGVRLIELDTHWVEGDLRIAHCGGFHSPYLNWLIGALNVLAKAFRRPIHWDSETIGCSPSLSSIATLDQRLLADAFNEINAWLNQPENTGEFLIIFFDDQDDLAQWGKVPELLRQILAVFPRELILTLDDLTTTLKGQLPSIDTLVGMGKQLLFISGADYGEVMEPLIFKKYGGICNFTEVLPMHVSVERCSVHTKSPAASPIPLAAGTLVRVSFCELQYGPLNCSMTVGYNSPLLDTATMAEYTQCGLNSAAPDSILPALMSSTIWSWAPNQPEPLFQAEDVSSVHFGKDKLGRTAYRLLHYISRWTPRWLRSIIGQDHQPGTKACAAIAQEDGRWYSVSCGTGLPTACRRIPEAGQQSPQLEWELSDPGVAAMVMCPAGYAADIPHCPRENMALAALLLERGVPAAQLPLAGPAYDPAWLHAQHAQGQRP